MTTTLLAIDPSYSMGWALFYEGELMHTGVIISTPHLGASVYVDAVKRCSEISAQLLSVMRINRPTHMAAEIATGSTAYDAVRMFGRMDGILSALACAENIPLLPVSPFDVKKWAKGTPLDSLAQIKMPIQDRKREVVARCLFLHPSLALSRSAGYAFEAMCDAIAVGHVTLEEM